MNPSRFCGFSRASVTNHNQTPEPRLCSRIIRYLFSRHIVLYLILRLCEDVLVRPVGPIVEGKLEEELKEHVI